MPRQSAVQGENPDKLTVSQVYSKAWDEFNIRVNVRQSIINLYIQVSAALLGFLIFLPIRRELVLTAGLAAQSPEPLVYQRNAFYAMPVIALVASVLLFVHDLSMNNLIRFMVKIEASNPQVEAYHTIFFEKGVPGGWGKTKVYFRILQSLCIAAIFGLFCQVAFVTGLEKKYLVDGADRTLYWILGGIAIFIKLVSALLRIWACLGKAPSRA
jgi:hypothetical protein